MSQSISPTPAGTASAGDKYIRTWREAFAQSMIIIMLGFGLVALIPALFSDEAAVSRTLKFVYLFIYLVGIIIAVFPFSASIRIGTFLVVILGLGISELLAYGILGDATLFFFAVVTIATVMLSPRAGWIALSISLAAIATIGFLSINGFIPAAPLEVGKAKVTDWFSTSGSFLMLSAVILFGVQRLQFEIAESQSQLEGVNRALREERSHLEENVRARTAELEFAKQASDQRARRLEIISSVARSISTMQELDQLLPVICQAVSEQFGYYHTGIFLVDERGEFAVLQAANSEGGQRMLRRNHRLRVGTTGIVGMTAAQGTARIAHDVGTDTVYFNNPDLPDTRSEMALPLIINNQVVGVLDVQSREVGAFQPEDLAVLTILANQISIVIENARLFGQTKKALADSQAIYQQYIKQDWAHFTDSMKNTGYTYNGVQITPITSITPAPNALQIPIKIRGLTVGTILIHSNDPLRTWSQDEINLAQAAAERAGLAIENFRLLTEAQRRAAKERTVGEITARISASVDVREIMKAAVEELGRAMSGAEVTLQIQDSE